MNRVILIGRLTRDPELRYTQSNVAVTTFTLAVNRPFSNQAGEREADFINIIVWRTLAENCHKYTKKGSRVAIDGRIQTRSREDESGNKKYYTEVIADNVKFLDPKEKEAVDSKEVNPYEEMGKQVKEEQQTFEYSDEDLPF